MCKWFKKGNEFFNRIKGTKYRFFMYNLFTKDKRWDDLLIVAINSFINKNEFGLYAVPFHFKK